ncbi:ankyrin repeat-containing domain protein [Hypoxylon sp. FL0543]|nr:ankyrin repeat-containing domain protein [Hypoxylon sp. FL0543]
MACLMRKCSDEFLQLVLESYKMEPRNLGEYLCHAASRNKMKTADCLLKLGAKMETKGYDIKTPLHLAVICNHLSMVAFLLDKGAEFDASGDSSRTALHAAALYGYLNRAELLFSRGASIDAATEDEKTPLAPAVTSTHWRPTKGEQRNMVEFLQGKGADVIWLDAKSLGRLDQISSESYGPPWQSVPQDIIHGILEDAAPYSIYLP